jgi:hypothetical protein
MKGLLLFTLAAVAVVAVFWRLCSRLYKEVCDMCDSMDID